MDPNQIVQKHIELDKEISTQSTQLLSYSSQEETDYDRDVKNRNNWFLEYFEGSRTSIDNQDYRMKLQSLTRDIRSLQQYAWGSYLNSTGLALTSHLNEAMKLISQCLHAQVCAVFLLDKYGFLVRQGFYGVDHNGKEIEDGWFSDEKYQVDLQSFVGSAAFINPEDDIPYGNIQYTPNLESHEAIDSTNLNKYKSRLGNPIARAISVPINNKYKTFGVLRILNTLDPQTGQIQNSKKYTLNDRDVIWLSLFSSQISNAIIDHERVFNRRLFSNLVTSTVYQQNTSYDAAITNNTVLDNTLKAIIYHDSNPFVFGIVRILDGNDQMVVWSMASFKETYFTDRIDNSIPRSRSNTFVNIALNSKEPVIITDITQSITQFNNRAWIDKHKFATFCCFPLTCHSVEIGTISFYTATKFEYDSQILEYIHTIADSISVHLYITCNLAFKAPTEFRPRISGNDQFLIDQTSKRKQSNLGYRTVKNSAKVGRISEEAAEAAVKAISKTEN